MDGIESEQRISYFFHICLYFHSSVLNVHICSNSSKAHTLHISPVCRYNHTHTLKHTHTDIKHTVPCSFPWRPSLDKRKTALSRAAVQLFSVVKHVSVWQSKLLFRFAVPDTDRAFKIWGEDSRHCSRCCKRYRQLFTPLCVLVFTDDFIHACVPSICVQIAVFCAT